jgi:epoxyqueuosine reductase
MHVPFYREWLAQGLHGEMAYLARDDAITRRADLTETMPGVRSVVVVAQDYFQEDPPGVPGDRSRGVVACYARGRDYHEALKTRLQDLLEWIRKEAADRGLAPEVRGFAYVDTGPVMERDLGNRGGLGWFGRNTMLIHPRRGSYFFLGILLLDISFPSSLPFERDHCGSCRDCLQACPTSALLGRDDSGAPVIDSRRCISYLTIELKGPIPRELRPALGNRIFGCDICQEVCPWNQRFAAAGDEYRPGPDTNGPGLLGLMRLSQDEFSTRFSGSPIKRAKRRGFLRNVAVALGNWGDVAAVPSLTAALSDEEPLIRGHAAWALGRILEKNNPTGPLPPEMDDARRALLVSLQREDDPWVREELELALGENA